MNKKKYEKSRSQSNYRRTVDYKDIPESFWIKRINYAKKIIDRLPPCHTHCPNSSKCKKLSEYTRKLGTLREVMEPRLDRNVRDDRKRLVELLTEINSLRQKIIRCIHVRKHLTENKGYFMWYPLSD